MVHFPAIYALNSRWTDRACISQHGCHHRKLSCPASQKWPQQGPTSSGVSQYPCLVPFQQLITESASCQTGCSPSTTPGPNQWRDSGAAGSSLPWKDGPWCAGKQSCSTGQDYSGKPSSSSSSTKTAVSQHPDLIVSKHVTLHSNIRLHVSSLSASRQVLRCAYCTISLRVRTY